MKLKKQTHSSRRNGCQVLLAAALIMALLAGNFQPVMAQAPAAGPDDAAELALFLEGALAVSMEANHVPGAVVVVVKDGEVFFNSGYGYADLENKRPVDPATTLFRPGSVSKLFTWTAVMQLVEQGKLDLDADVNQYLDFEIPTAFDQPITLRHLMSHTPGFEDKGQNLFKIDPSLVVSLEEYLKNNLPARVFAPGTIGAYSNYGTALSGYIVERVSGLPFTAYVEQNIFVPLGMQHATFEQPLPASLSADMSNGYNFVNGQYLQGEFEYVVGNPAGALSASGLDMGRFMIAHLQNGAYQGQRILQEETAIQMHSPLYSPDPRVDGMAHGFFYSHAYGQYTLSHGGDTMLFHSNLMLFPELNLGFFISTNGTAGYLVVEQVVDAFLEHYFPLEPGALTTTDDFAARAALYNGNYIVARSNVTGFEKVMNLTAPIRFSVTADEQVLLFYGGQVTLFEEMEPGLLVDPEQPHNRMVLKEIDGQVTLHPTMPFVFLKTAWYESTALHALIFIGGLLLFVGASLGWVFAFFRSRAEHASLPAGAHLSRVTASLFGMGLLLFLFIFMMYFADINPAMGVPAIYFADPPGLELVMAIPLVLAGVAVLMLVFCLLAWIKGWWKLGGRLFYTLLSLWAFSLLWGLYYWNLLF